jgi:amino acid transporter
MALRIVKGLLRLSVVALVLWMGGVAIVTWQMFLPAAATEIGSPCPRDGKYHDPFCPGDAIPTAFWAFVLLALVLAVAMMLVWAFRGFLPTRRGGQGEN